MACDHPIHGFKAPGGKVHFSRSGAWRDMPITLACGQCAGCRLERSRQWAVRCMHESSQHERNSFITLTYDDTNLPTNRTLIKKHWQEFAKKLRGRLGSFRFFHCGEYGDLNGRPHYHAALFGIDFQEDRVLDKMTKEGHALYKSKTLTETWAKGHAWIGELTFESAAYVARYIMKKRHGQQALIEYGVKISGLPFSLEYIRLPEYTTMSLKPGIGQVWIEKYMEDVYPQDHVIVKGKKTRPPKYYDEQYEKRNPKGYERLKTRRRAQGAKHEEDNTYDRKEVKAKVRDAKNKIKTREI